MNPIVIKTFSFVFTAALVFSSMASRPAMADGGPLHATLAGAEEVPGPGDPDGTGTGSVTLNPGLGEICFEIRVSNVGTVTHAHIHEAAEGVAGPKRLELNSVPTSGFSQGCQPADQELLKRMLQNPSGFYMNIHTTDFPGGAVRGQFEH
jgi:hypothetical protein